MPFVGWTTGSVLVLPDGLGGPSYPPPCPVGTDFVRTAEWIRRVPWSIPLIAAALMMLGLLGLARCEDFGEGSRHYLRQQLVWSGVGLAAMLAAALPSYRRLAAWSYAFFASSIVLLVLVYFFPTVNGSHRWLRVGRFGVQPSEFAKVAFVLALARYLMYRENYRRLRGLLPPLLLASLPVLLILKEPDLGTAAVFLPVLLVMLLVAGARRQDVLRVIMAGVVLLPLFWMQMSPYQKSRVTVLLHPPVAGERPTATAYQSHQARTMMALGGAWGSFLSGQPTEDMAAYHLPEDHSDFILCVLIERFGLPGLAAVLLLYGLLVWRVAAVASETREPFGRLLAVGAAALVAVQVLMNAGVTVGLLPVTGLPLPLVSYGGSGLLAHCLALGLAINVALRPGYEMTNEPFRYRMVG
jgi:rod shape determining protein RodA